MHALLRAACAVASCAALAAAPQLANAASGTSSALLRAAPSKVTICHATSSDTNPYVTITISQAGLHGHSGHADDLIPAPADGCPTTLDEHEDAGDEHQDAGDDGEGTTDEGTTDGDGSSEDHADPTAPMTICHATGSARWPYRTMRVAGHGHARHAAHGEDIVPAPPEGCPTPDRDVASGNRCRSSRQSLAVASGPHAVTVRSCAGTMLRIWGDPWVTYRERGMRRPVTFPIGYGDASVNLPGGVRVSWTTDPLAHNSLSSLTIESMAGTTRIMPTDYDTDAGSDRSAQVALSTYQLRALRNALLRCTGDPQKPIDCTGSGSSTSTQRPGRPQGQQPPRRPQPPRPGRPPVDRPVAPARYPGDGTRLDGRSMG